MPITPLYPGISIEALPSSAHTLASRPSRSSSGYKHPFKTVPFGKRTSSCAPDTEGEGIMAHLPLIDECGRARCIGGTCR